MMMAYLSLLVLIRFLAVPYNYLERGSTSLVRNMQLNDKRKRKNWLKLELGLKDSALLTTRLPV